MTDRTDRYDEFVFEEINLSANVSEQALNLSGTYLYEAEIVASLDNEVSVVFKTANGTPIITLTDIDATSGLIHSLDSYTDGEYVACVGRPTVTVTKLGSGTLQLIVVGKRSPQ